jgi:GDP-L-fucose synthase
MKKDSRIFIAGHRGLVGSAIVRKLKEQGYKNLILRARDELDLRSQKDVRAFFREEQPEYVFLSAAKVGGILANKNYKADFILDNLSIQNNVIETSYKNDVKKLVFLGSSCIYPKFASQPIKESELLTGALEETNDSYAVAKIAGITACKALKEQYNFNAISLMPTNLYGINDNFDLNNSHVIPALIKKLHDAKKSGADSVNLWGDGTPIREFMFADDLADATIFCMLNYNDSEIINIGTGIGTTIKSLANLISEIVGFNGLVIWNSNQPNGTPKKILNVEKLDSLGWKYQTKLDEGLKITYDWYLKNKT